MIKVEYYLKDKFLCDREVTEPIKPLKTYFELEDKWYRVIASWQDDQTHKSLVKEIDYFTIPGAKKTKG